MVSLLGKIAIDVRTKLEIEGTVVDKCHQLVKNLELLNYFGPSPTYM